MGSDERATPETLAVAIGDSVSLTIATSTLVSSTAVEDMFVGNSARERATIKGAENAKLKKLLAEAMLDNAMLKDIASKKW